VRNLIEKWQAHKKDIPRTTADLDDPSKFSVADAKEFGRLLASLEAEVADMKLFHAAYHKALRSLETAMLKGMCRIRSA
jgi:hypothetical protein